MTVCLPGSHAAVSLSSGVLPRRDGTATSEARYFSLMLPEAVRRAKRFRCSERAASGRRARARRREMSVISPSREGVACATPRQPNTCLAHARPATLFTAARREAACGESESKRERTGNMRECLFKRIAAAGNQNRTRHAVVLPRFITERARRHRYKT